MRQQKTAVYVHPSLGEHLSNIDQYGRQTTKSIEPAAQVLSRGPDRRVAYRGAEVNSVQHGSLGLAITRVDAREKMDREGSYTIRLGPADRAGSLANDLPQ